MSYQMRNDPRARKAGRFIYRVQKEIQKAFLASGLKQQEIAEKLGVNRSVVNKRLLGEANLTLRTIADLAWAMDAEIEFALKSRVNSHGQNRFEPAQTVRAISVPAVETTAIPRRAGEFQVRYETEDA